VGGLKQRLCRILKYSGQGADSDIGTTLWIGSGSVFTGEVCGRAITHFADKLSVLIRITTVMHCCCEAQAFLKLKKKLFASSQQKNRRKSGCVVSTWSRFLYGIWSLLPRQYSFVLWTWPGLTSKNGMNCSLHNPVNGGNTWVPFFECLRCVAPWRLECLLTFTLAKRKLAFKIYLKPRHEGRRNSHIYNNSSKSICKNKNTD